MTEAVTDEDIDRMIKCLRGPTLTTGPRAAQMLNSLKAERTQTRLKLAWSQSIIEKLDFFPGRLPDHVRHELSKGFKG